MRSVAISNDRPLFRTGFAEVKELTRLPLSHITGQRVCKRPRLLKNHFVYVTAASSRFNHDLVINTISPDNLSDLTLRS